MYFVPTSEVGTLPGQGESAVIAKGVHVCPPNSHTDLLEGEEEYESPERLADIAEEKVPQHVREQRDEDRLWKQQHDKRTKAEAAALEAQVVNPPKGNNWKAAYPKTPEGLAKLEYDIVKAGGQQKLACQLGLSERYGRQRINDWKRKLRAAVICSESG